MDQPTLPQEMDQPFFEQMLDHLHEVVLVLDGQSRVIYVNRTGRQKFRRKHDDFLGHLFGNALGCLHAEENECGGSSWCPCGLAERISDALAQPGRVFRETLALPIRQGDSIEVRNFRVTLLPLETASGDSGPVCVLIDDRTQLVRRTDELRLYQEKVERRATQCETLTETILQDVRVPLVRLVKSLAADQGGLPPSDFRWELDFLALTVENLLRLSQMDTEGLPVSKELLDPVKVVTGLLDVLEAGPSVRGIDLSFQSPAMALPTVSADLKLLHRVLETLVRTAMVQADEGSEVRLEISSLEGNRVGFSILYHGPALPEEHLDSIFDPFFHLERPGGLGRRNRGLAFCRLAMVSMGGTVKAQNLEGGTVAFTVIAPVRKNTGDTRKRPVQK